MIHVIQKILENNPDKDIIIADGFEEAIVGYDKFSNSVVYSTKKCIKILTTGEDKIPIELAESHIANLAEYEGATYIEEVSDILDINLN